jgi:hypothetical protein
VDPVLRRRIAALLLVAGIAVGALAIADVGPFDDPPTEEERVQDAVEDFFAAAAEGDGKAWCRLLTESARKQLEINLAQRLQTSESFGCVELLVALKSAYKGSTVEVRSVSVSGNRARAEVRFKLQDEPAQPRTLLLEEEKDRWHISDPDY